MEEITKRFILLRKELGLSQRSFGDSIGLSNSGISNIENGIRKVTDQHIKLICSEFNVNEEWIRGGTGDIFFKSTVFSLDEHAKKNNLSDLEAKIMKDYMELDPATRKGLMSYFKTVFGVQAETAAAIAERAIDEEVESYRRELEAEQKGATLLASDERKEKSV